MQQGISGKLDWNRMLGFEQVADDRAELRAAGAKVGSKVGGKPINIAAKVGTKVGGKPGPAIGRVGAKIGVKPGFKPEIKPASIR